MPVCGSTRCGECKGFLGCSGEPGSVASGSTILDLRFTKCWDSVRPEGAGIGTHRRGAAVFTFHLSREREARVFTMGGLVFPMLAGREGMRFYWERYPAAPDDIHAAHGRFISQARSGCFHFSPFTRARSASFHEGVVAEFPNGRFVGRFCFIGNDIRLRRTISMLRMDDIQPLRG